MISEALNEYLVKKTFGVLGYVCVVVHFICGLVLTAVTAGLNESENGNFFCFVDANSTAMYKKLVDQACLTRYNKTFSPHLPLYGFVLLSIGLPVLISVIYSLTVGSRVSEIDSIQETSNIGNESLNYGRRTVYVFYCYIIHLTARLLIGIVVTALQHTYFYSNGFDFEFICNYDSSLVLCQDGTAFTKRSFGIAVTVTNSIVEFVILGEVIYLSQRYLNSNWSCDTQFVTDYFLRKQYAPVDSSLPLTPIECKYIYRQQILSDLRKDFNIKLVIHTERAPLKFPKNAQRHEIYHVYTKIPGVSIELEEVKHLFYPNADTKGKFPRSILAIGRPGIGKTALTEKIRRDWAEASNQVNPDYRKKIVFLFPLRWFNKLSDKFTLKNFLQFGTALDSDKFACIYEEVIANPQAAIIVFDGLDELRKGSPTQFSDESRAIPNDPNTEISAANLFVKLVLGDMLNGATVVVTSRPTAAEFFPILKFDRCVEIIGFTPEKIEEYVSEFCVKENIVEYKAKIWEKIHSSSELLNLCYIPVNCFIVCVTLSGCLRDSDSDDDVLPTTLTALYKHALVYLEKYDKTRKTETGPMAETTLTKLKQLAFIGMKNGDLLFNKELVDDDMRNSSLLNSIPNPKFRCARQFCFIHLTIQEFLAARHVIQSFTPDEIKTFLSAHLRKSEWHLVIQFLAGLLGTKEQYKNCLWMLAESLNFGLDIVYLSDYELFVMKCLREVNKENIVQNICETTVLKDIISISDCCLTSVVDWTAVTYVCKHMKNLSEINLDLYGTVSENFSKFLQNGCFSKVYLTNDYTEVGETLRALMKSKCTLEHKHAKLSVLSLSTYSPVDRKDQTILREFFKGKHARHLHDLCLRGPFAIPALEDGEILNKVNCPELTNLEVGLSRPCVTINASCKLIDTCCKLMVHKLRKLDLKVTLRLTQAHTLSLCKAMTDAHCKLTTLCLIAEALDNESGKIIFDALRHQHCKLTHFSLTDGNLTDECIPSIFEAIEDEHCCLKYLNVSEQKFTDQGKQLLRNIRQHPRCKSRGLEISC